MDDALGSGFEVGIIKNNKGGVAAEFERNFFYGVGTVAHEGGAGFGGAGEGEFSDELAGGEGFADLRRVAGDDGEDAVGNTSLFGEHGKSERGERSLAGGFDDHGASGGEGGTGFAGDHGSGEVPRGDGGADTDGLFDGDESAAFAFGGDGVAVGAFGLFGEPFDEGGGVGDFGLGFSEGFALFGGHDAGEIILVPDDEVEPAAQDGGAILSRSVAPGWEGAVGGFDGAVGFGFFHGGNMTDERLGRGIGDGDGRA